MTEKQIRRLLLQVRNTQEKTSHIREHIRVLESNRLKVTASYSLAGGGGSGATSKIEELTVKLLEVEEKLRLEVGNYVEQLKQAEKLLGLLRQEKQEYSAVLRMRYLDGLSWKRIGNAMSYSRAQINRFHDRALEKLAEKTTAKGKA